jgi:hypothetical protein
VVRKKLFPTPDRPAAGYAEGIYTPACNEATYAELYRLAEEALAEGKSVVVDSTFRRQKVREEFRLLAERTGAAWFILEISCDEETVRRRLLGRVGDPHEVSDGRWEHFAEQKGEYESPAPGEAIEIDGACPVERAVDQALKKMGLLL